MATPQPNSRYEPAARRRCQAISVDGSVYMWAGAVDGHMPRVHNGQEKRRFISCVEVFNCESGHWIRQPTSGAPPLGVCGYGCTAVGDTLHFFGGWCNHGDCHHNDIHSLSTSSLHWVELSPTSSEGVAPMRKSNCDMVAFKDGEGDILYVVAGWGPTPLYRQPGAQYIAVGRDRVKCNEQHMFSLSTRKWSSPNITGQPPPPCSNFTLTLVGERRAALFGGESGSAAVSDDLFIVDLSRDTVHWTWIKNPVNRSVEWPERRYCHATTCVSGTQLVIVGGLSGQQRTISDCWIGDITTKQWKKLSLPDSVTERYSHSLSAQQLSSHSVLLVIFGGRTSRVSVNLSHTVLIELILQEDGGQWVVGMILEGAALEDKRFYQLMLSKWRSTAVDQGVIHQLEEVQQQLQQERERAREVEQRLTRENQQLTREKEQMVQQSLQAGKREQQLTETSEQNQQLTREKEQLTSATPTLLNLMEMNGADGQPLRVIETIAAGNYKRFGMYLLRDNNRTMVDLIEKHHKDAESVTEAILQKWLTSDAPTRTYQHLIECLRRQSKLGALAEQLITTVVQAKATQF